MRKILTFGEPLLAFHIPNKESIIHSGGHTSFMSLAGSEINTGVALKRLGNDVTILSILPNNDLGKYYKQILNDIGINTQYLSICNGSIGTMYVKDNKVTYDRLDSAFYRMSCDVFPLRTIFKEHYDWIHLTGITASLSLNNIFVWKTIIEYGLSMSIPISIDLNHRPALIEFRDLWKIIKPFTPFIEILFVSKENIPMLLNIEKSTDIPNLLNKLQLKQLLYCIKEPTENNDQLRYSILHQQDTSIQSEPIVQSVKEPIGGGDTYSAGFIHTTLTNQYTMKDKLHYCDLLTIQSQNHRGHFLRPTCAEKNSP